MQNLSVTFFQLTPQPHLILSIRGDILSANPAAKDLLVPLDQSVIQKSIYDFIDDIEKFDNWLKRPDHQLPPIIVRLNAHVVGDVQFIGRKIQARIIISLTLLDSLIDTPNVSQRLSTQDLQRLIVTDALRDSILAISNTLELEVVLNNILEGLARVIPLTVADVMLIDKNIAYVVRQKGYDKHGLADVVQSLRFPIDTTPTLSQMMQTQEAIIIDDMHDYPQWSDRPQQDWMRTYLGVPIRSNAEVIGFLNLVSDKPNTFHQRHIDWLRVFAAQAAVAISNAQIHERARELAVAEERQRMAREIHDSVSQMLFSSNMIAESLENDARITDKTVQKHLQHLRRLNRGALAEMRLLLMEYKPENLVEAELPRLLTQLKHAVEGRKQIHINLHIDDSNPAPPNVRLVFYRIAQEALNNIIKHANTNEAYVSLITTVKDVTLIIEDEGVGFDDADKKHHGDGLQNMRDRASSIDGTLTIDTKLGRGTRITLHWLRPD